MSKVVPFSRSTDYLHQRAMKNRRDRNLLDAVELLRRAIERDGDNSQYQMDLAETYCEMGCHLESNRVLTRILAGDDPQSECYFGMSCNFYGMNDLDSSYKALMCFLSDDPRATKRPEVSEMLQTLVMVRELGAPSSRKKNRAHKMAQRGCDLMKAEQYPEAERLLRQSLRVDGRQSETRALLAMGLMLMEQPEAAVREALRALRQPHPPMQTLCLCAQVFYHADRGQAALKIIDAALRQKSEGDDLRMLLDALCEMGEHERIYELSLRALRETPYDRELLHMHAAAVLNTGRPRERAVSCWTRVRRIDPDDAVARLYLEAELAEGENVPYAYRLSAEARLARIQYLGSVVEKGLAGIEEVWDQADELRKTLAWALGSGEIYFNRVALNLLAAVERKEAEYLLRDYLLRPDAPQFLKRQALLLLGLRRAKPPFLATGFDKFLLISPNDSGRMPRMPISYKKVLKMALRACAQIRKNQLSALTVAWLRYVCAFDGGFPLLRDCQSWAAALIYSHLRHQEDPPTARLIARMFGLNWRKIEYLAGHIERVANRVDLTVLTEDEKS